MMERLNVGYIYIAKNKAIPNLIKIGMTNRDVESRVKELSGTGVPGEWKVVFSFFVPHALRVEQMVHGALIEARYRKDREFFATSVEHAKQEICKQAEYCIAQYPGWPNPKSVKNHLDKRELEILKKRQEAKRLHDEEKRDFEEEKRRKEKKRILLIDEATRKEISKGPIGWWAIILSFVLAVFFFRKGVTREFDVVSIVAVLCIIGFPFLSWGLRRIEKKEVIEKRKKHNLPSIKS